MFQRLSDFFSLVGLLFNLNGGRSTLIPSVFIGRVRGV